MTWFITIPISAFLAGATYKAIDLLFL